jgi:hypothetical protein
MISLLPKKNSAVNAHKKESVEIENELVAGKRERERQIWQQQQQQREKCAKNIKRIQFDRAQ